MKYVAIRKASVLLLCGAVVMAGVLGTIPNSTLAASAQGQTSKQAVSQVSAASSVVYQNVTQYAKKTAPGSIVWTGKGLTVTAHTVVKEDKADFEQNVIESIVIQKGAVRHEIDTADYDDSWLDLASVAESPATGWVAIQASRSAGASLLLVNLDTGESIVLNDRLQQEVKGTLETITAYQWSPTGEQIAFSYGDPSKSTLAIYDAAKDSVLRLPRTTNYISTSLILWHKNGKAFDFISEHPSDRFTLFRYDTKSSKVKPVRKLTRKQMGDWLKLDKYPSL
ncbi:hypothetical protein [Paenibacillus sp. JJ-223]|uniref:hypothetical protein n=1 Tax=Paenibacillus sp. JJ-223 TaxID=2905647 RepID=UPI001F3A9153|nr:hypothetical protein [Paenibacillus sp. JJ-223]CAH1197088.1 hypothetical protein PAECIP111890_01124 [Paenibacillus sp. JJ-223]